jgi:hypothetical protein
MMKWGEKGNQQNNDVPPIYLTDTLPKFSYLPNYQQTEQF